MSWKDKLGKVRRSELLGRLCADRAWLHHRRCGLSHVSGAEQHCPRRIDGVATVLNYLMDVPVGLTSMLMNIPLFIIGYKAMGRVFVVRSFIATVLFSAAIDLIHVPAVTTDPLLGTLYGGVLLGIGLGLILRGGATTGGTDMVARMVHKRLPFISVGMFLLLIDCAVVVLAGICVGLNEGLYAMISIAVSSKLIDVVMAGLSQTRACYIITSATDEVTQRIMKEMDRGRDPPNGKGRIFREGAPRGAVRAVQPGGGPPEGHCARGGREGLHVCHRRA